MAKYRKRPILIDAIQWLGGEKKWSRYTPKWITEALKNGDIVESHDGTEELIINTLEGYMVASKNDFIIKGLNGEMYPCKPDIFEKTYAEVWL